MKAKLCAALAAGLLLAGCGPYYTPIPTVKSIKPSDLVGRWRYQSEIGADVDLTLMPGSTFTQAARLGGKAIRRVGRWSLAGSELELNGALASTAEGKPKIADWRVWVVDAPSASASQLFSLFGADDWGSEPGADPDSGHYFERLP